MNRKKRTIGVDFDDVLMDTNTALASFHNEIYGTSFTRDHIFSYSLEKVWGCTPEEVQQRIEVFFDSPSHALILPVPGATKAIRQLSENYRLVVITARPSSKRNITQKLLDQYFPGLLQELHFTHNVEGNIQEKRTKAEVCKEFGIEVFIEDALTHALPIASLGITTFLFDAPWNREAIPDSVIRVKSWGDILAKMSEE